MPKRRKQRKNTSAEVKLLKDLLIVELAKAGVPQTKIQSIVRCDIKRVNQIAKYVKKRKTSETNIS